MWRFATLAVILLFSLPIHADSGRAIHNLTPLAWDQKLAKYARRWAASRLDDCQTLLHSPNSPYGENLFWAQKSHWNASWVVKYWGDEVKHYDPKTNECVNNTVCGHYTQIVWNTTERIGCTHVLCNKNEGHLFVCSYDPPGNIYYHGPFGGRFPNSIVDPPSSNHSSPTQSGSQFGTTGVTVASKGIASGTTGHPANKSYGHS
ncbi:unnamed protein product [Dovyalis caffra]|uniref:SCP domain-containing protein n=1 Tax=Dovyalis caffra TaxID=77055 RepID=A0AAV1RYZ2_9ROSI|nr:unnamed protein product [Dovyalis caffra]